MTALNIDSLKPGQTVRLTVTRSPGTVDDEQTVLRLMRTDADIKRALKKGSRERMQNLLVRSRGGRPWEVREKSAKIARAERGVTFTMKYTPVMANDLRRVADLLAVAQ